MGMVPRLETSGNNELSKSVIFGGGFLESHNLANNSGTSSAPSLPRVCAEVLATPQNLKGDSGNINQNRK